MTEPQVTRATLERLIAGMAPHATLVRSGRLRGSASRRVFAVTYLDAERRTRRVVVRLPPERGAAVANAEREYRTLSILHDAGLPVPKPLYLDTHAMHLGRPAIVMEHAGRTDIVPTDRESWLLGFASALAT